MVPVAPSSGACGELDLQVRRLDVENGDILVVRTRSRLTQTRADAIHDMVATLASRHGVRDVTVMVLDDCSDLTVERPKPIRVYKPASMGKTEMLPDTFYRRGGHQPHYAGSQEPVPPKSGSGVKPPQVPPQSTDDDDFRREANRVLGHALATGDFREVTHRHVRAATRPSTREGTVQK